MSYKPIKKVFYCILAILALAIFPFKWYLEKRAEHRYSEKVQFEEKVKKTVAEELQKIQSEHAESVIVPIMVDFQDVKKVVSLCQCEVVQTDSGEYLLAVSFKNNSHVPVLLDIYSHSGCEQVCPPGITSESGAGEETLESEPVPNFPDSVSISPQETFCISCPLPATCIGWLNEGKNCFFSYTIQFWKHGLDSVDGDGDMCVFSARINNSLPLP